MERGAFMRKTEKHQGGDGAPSAVALLLGLLFAFGVELIVLLLGSFLVSAEVFRPDTEMQVTATACLIGCFIGGSVACRKWKSGKLLCGLLVGLLCFALIFVIAIISSDNFELKGQGLIELAGCLIGGGFAGIVGRSRKKKKHKTRQK